MPFDLVCLDDHDPELRRAWRTFPDPVTEHQGEEWQYMGSRHRDGSWKHCFRHRCHPETGARLSREVSAAVDWQPTSPDK